MVDIFMNGQKLALSTGTTILEAAKENGIEIPTLCYHQDLTPYGGCRLCVVEVKGERALVPSCTREIQKGMRISTDTRKIRRYRRLILEMLLARYHDSGYPSSSRQGYTNELHYWARKYRVSLKRNMKKSPTLPINADPNPFIWVDMNKCILCSRCVRACDEIQGRFVWNIAGRGIQNHIIAGAKTDLISARCESCGACVAYCPTGALDNKMSMSSGSPDRVVTTTCTYCGVGCQVDLHVRKERIIRVVSSKNAPVNGMHLCVKGRYGYDFVHHPDRLTQPKIRKYLLNGQHRVKGENRGDWVEVDWDTAIDIAAKRLNSITQASGSDAVGVLTSAKCTNEENYLMNKFSRQVLGTNNIDHCARL